MSFCWCCSCLSRCCFSFSSVSSFSRHTAGGEIKNSIEETFIERSVKVQCAGSRSDKLVLHFPLRSSTSPSAVRSHLSHKNTWTSGPSGSVPPRPPSSARPSSTSRTSTRLQCQSRLGYPVRASRCSRIRTIPPSGSLARTRTGHTC